MGKEGFFFFSLSMLSRVLWLSGFCRDCHKLPELRVWVLRATLCWLGFYRVHTIQGHLGTSTGKIPPSD